MKQCIAYLRVSTGEQSVEAQRMAVEQWANQHGYQVVRWFEDDATSGTIPAIKRRGFNDMLQYLKSNHIDAVLVYELSRIGRSFRETLEAIHNVEEHTPLISCSPKEEWLQNLDSSVRQLILSILTWVAERERELLIQRTKDGLQKAKISGKKLGRPEKSIDKGELLRLLAAKKPKVDIAARLGISRCTLYRKLKRL